MALKANMFAVAMAIVVVVAAQIMAEKVVVEEENGWNIVQRQTKGVDDTNHQLLVLGGRKQNLNKVSIRWTLVDACSNYNCHPGHTSCPVGCPDCPEDEENPDAKGVQCPDE